MSNSSRYAVIWLLGLVVCLALVGVFNLAVDPYDVIGSPRVAGFNAFKSYARTHTRLSKTYQVARLHPGAVMLGTSRVDIGLDPENPAWPDAVRPVYNFGVPGADLYQMVRNLEDAGAAGTLRLAVIGLDFEAFLITSADPGPQPRDEEDRLLVTPDGRLNPARARQHLQDIFLSTLTLAAFEDSLGTIAAQHQANSLDLTDHGSTTDGAFRQLAGTDGYNELFTQKELDYVGRNRRAALGLADQPQESPGLAYVRQMLDYCRDHDIDAILVIPPYHADLLEIFDTVGLWSRFEAWKADLAKLAAAYRAAEPGRQVRLWDFSGYDRYSTEDVPAQGDRRSEVEWFWEPGHFKKSLGDLMLRRVLAGDQLDIGVELTPDAIDARLAKIRADRDAYRAIHRSEMSRIAAIFTRSGVTPQ
jgi:hypothetical protein